MLKQIDRLLISCWGLFLCFSSITFANETFPVKKGPADALPVKVATIIQTEYQTEILAYAKLDENRQALFFERQGSIKKMFFTQGETIKKGQVLAQLDTTRLENEKKKAEEVLKYSQLKLDQAKKLIKNKYISLERVDDKLHAHEMAKLKLQYLKKEIDKHLLYSPINGEILSKEIKYKQPITLTTPIFYVKNQEKPWEVKAQLTQREVLLVKEKDPVTIFFHAMPDTSFSGQVIQIEKITTSTDHMVSVYIHLNNEKQLLDKKHLFYPGMTAKVVIKISKSDSQTLSYLIPFKALFNVQKSAASIYVVDDQHRAKKIDISYHTIKDGYAVVLTDLSPYQQVITDGTKHLKSGHSVSF